MAPQWCSKFWGDAGEWLQLRPALWELLSTVRVPSVDLNLLPLNRRPSAPVLACFFTIRSCSWLFWFWGQRLGEDIKHKLTLNRLATRLNLHWRTSRIGSPCSRRCVHFPQTIQVTKYLKLSDSKQFAAKSNSWVIPKSISEYQWHHHLWTCQSLLRFWCFQKLMQTITESSRARLGQWVPPIPPWFSSPMALFKQERLRHLRGSFDSNQNVLQRDYPRGSLRVTPRNKFQFWIQIPCVSFLHDAYSKWLSNVFLQYPFNPS